MKIENPSLGHELIGRLFHLPQKSPKKIQIEITNRCNLSCELCPREKFNLPNEDIDSSVFKQILSKLNGVDVIFPVGWGESFLHTDFNSIVDSIKENKSLIRLPTNGIIINNEQAIETALKIDYLTFSVDEMHLANKHKVFDIIENLLLKRDTNNSKKPYITIQLVLSENSKGFFDIIKKAKLIGVDRVNLIRPNLYDSNHSSTWKNRKGIYKEAERLSKQLEIKIDMFEYALFTGFKRFLWKKFKGIFRINSWCPRLSDFLYITIDGKATPCCYLPRYIVGDLMTQDINEIWNGENMTNFRKNHKQVCHNCQILKIK